MKNLDNCLRLLMIAAMALCLPGRALAQDPALTTDPDSNQPVKSYDAMIQQNLSAPLSAVEIKFVEQQMARFEVSADMVESVHTEVRDQILKQIPAPIYSETQESKTSSRTAPAAKESSKYATFVPFPETSPVPLVSEEAQKNERMYYSLFENNDDHFWKRDSGEKDRWSSLTHMALSPGDFFLSLTGFGSDSGGFLNGLFSNNPEWAKMNDLLQDSLTPPDTIGKIVQDADGNEFVVLDAVTIDDKMAGIHFLMNPPQKMHPFLRAILYQRNISKKMLYWYLAKRQKVNELHEKAQAGQGKIRYKGKIWDFAIKPPPDDMGGLYELIQQVRRKSEAAEIRAPGPNAFTGGQAAHPAS